jgi:hypothetical protein
VYVHADSAEVGRAPFTVWAPRQRPWTLVTDASATEEQLAPFRVLGNVEVVVVPLGGHAQPSAAPETV